LAGYSIDKPLPAGLVFDPTTGIISGTPTLVSPATNYTITAYNVTGSSSKVINIQVLATLPKSVITLPPPTQYDIDASNILQTGATSNNTQTPITYTSSNPAVAYIGSDGQIHVVAPGSTTITFNQAGNANFLPADQVSAIYNIQEYQFIQFPAIAPKYICSADFSANAVSNTSVIPLSYSSSNTAVATVSSTGIIHITGLGTSIITVSQGGNDLYIAAEPKTQIVTVNALPIPTIAVSPDVYYTCDGISLTYTALSSDAGTKPTYHWTLNGKASGTNANTYTSTTLKTGDLITCTVINNDGCMPVSSQVSNTVSLTSDPNVTYALSIAIVTPGPLFRGTPLTFKATPSNNLQTPPVYQWYVNGQKVGSNSATFNTSTLLGGEVITCTMAAGGKCIVNPLVNSNVIVMGDLPMPVKIEAPNTFTPNGDGVNDTWQIAGLSAFDKCSVNVYNRYGAMLYQSIGYGIPWDGTYNKNALPVGTYYYIIDLKNGTQVLSGYVTIIR
jgi:gliding motility-associated-like protein